MRADTSAVVTGDEAIAIALRHINGDEAALDGVDILLAGASARDTGDYWIVTVTRSGLTLLSPPRIIAVTKADGSARSLFVEEHEAEEGHHPPRRFR